MLHTTRSYAGMVTAPHHLASQSGLDVLRDGGNAIEAMIAAAATIAVAYPHMNGLGGDGFWLIGSPGGTVTGIQACGRSAMLATRERYRGDGHDAIPGRGPLAALTVAGAVSGWQQAQALSAGRHGGRLPWSRLLEDAARLAVDGVAVTRSLHQNATAKLAELAGVTGFADTFLDHGVAPAIGARLCQPRLADTLRRLADAGPGDFYRGEIAHEIARDLEAAGSPLRLDDLEAHRALEVAPLQVAVGPHTVYNLPPPTQGLASLLLLALYASLQADDDAGIDFVHRLVECTKAAFRIRDRYVTDPDRMSRPASSFLSADALAAMRAGISLERAAPWPHPAQPGDTVWLAAADGNGLCVSYIQSLYWEFGAGLVLPGTGITWQNRGASFSLEDDHANRLDPGRLPFHTIQPALAALSGGRMMAYGTMGGEGQPQTQAMLFARHVLHGRALQDAVTAPRWLLGRTWGDATTSLKLERRIDPAVIAELGARGHVVEPVSDFADMMGHAGAIVRHPDGLLEGACDPRGNGTVAAR